MFLSALIISSCATAQSLHESDIVVHDSVANLARGNLARHLLGGPSYQKLHERRSVLVIFNSSIPGILEARRIDAGLEPIEVGRAYEVGPGSFCEVMSVLSQRFPHLKQLQVLVTLYNPRVVSRWKISEGDRKACSRLPDLEERSVIIINPA